jgi:hypothetical protein
LQSVDERSWCGEVVAVVVATLERPVDTWMPRVLLAQECSGSRGREAVELAAAAGLRLDPWQVFVLERALGLCDGRWAAFEVGLNVARQNGKGAVLEVREIAGLFLFGEELIIHSAHEFATSQEHFRRLENLVRDTPALHEQVKRYSHSHGEEGIELRDGRRIIFKTRTKGSARGFSCDLLVLDEAMVISDAAVGAMVPTLRSRAAATEHGPQVWYAGSAVDQEVHDHGVVWSRVRERGVNGDDPDLAYFEWSVDADHPSLVSDEMAEDEELWALANPGLGIRITAEHMRREQRSLDPRTFAVELLGAGDYPRTDGVLSTVIRLEDWLALKDALSEVLDPVCVAFDVSPDRTAAVAVAGTRADGLFHVEVIKHRSGTGWLAAYLAGVVERQDPAVVVCDGFGPAASVVREVEEAGVKVFAMTSGEHAQACGRLVDAVNERTVRHLGSDELLAAIRGAKTRPLNDAWAWSRKNSNVDICPLVAVTLALSAALDNPDGGEMRIY